MVPQKSVKAGINNARVKSLALEYNTRMLTKMASTPKTIILTGPTATGKSGVALDWARRFKSTATPFEIINADSLNIYRGFNTGTAKPTREERAEIPHHLIDIRDPHEIYTAADFVRDVNRCLEEIQSRGSRALIVGGTGFYLKALLYGLWDAPSSDPQLRADLEALPTEVLLQELRDIDSVAALRIGPSDRYRMIRALEIHKLSGKTLTELEATQNHVPDARFKLFVIDREKEELDGRIADRARLMLNEGLVEEVRTLLADFPEARALQSVGYAETVTYLRGEKPEGRVPRPGLEGLFDEIILGTRQLAKRQRTWFRGEKASRIFILDRERDRLETEAGFNI